MGKVSHQLLKLGCIFSHSHTSLLKLQELRLFLVPNILGKVFLKVGTDKHLNNSQLASLQVVSHSETLHTWNSHHLSLDNGESISPAPQTWLHIQPVILPCLSSKNSISFLFLTSSGKYFSKNTFLKTSQVTSWPLASRHWWVFSHQYSASSIRVYVPKATFCPSRHAITRKIFSISLIQFWGPLGLYPPLNEGGLFHWKRSNPWYSTAPTASPLFGFSIAWAKTWRASSIAWSFRPAITPYTHLEVRHGKNTHKKKSNTTITSSYLVTFESWCLETLTLIFYHLYFLIACHVIPLHFTNYTDGQSDNSWHDIETRGIVDIRKPNMLWLQQSNFYNTWKDNKANKILLQTTDIKHSTWQPEHAQKNIVDSQLTGRKVQPALIQLI